MVNPAERPGGGQPWLAVMMLFVTTALLIATVVSDDAHSVQRFTIVALWWLTAIAALLKERVAYGMGDRVTLFGAVLILAVTVSAALMDYRRTGGIGALGTLSLAVAVLLLVKVFRTVMARGAAAGLRRDW